MDGKNLTEYIISATAHLKVSLFTTGDVRMFWIIIDNVFSKKKMIFGILS